MNNTLDNIIGNNPYINIVIGDFNARNTAWWGDTTNYPGESIADIRGLHGLHQITNLPTVTCSHKDATWMTSEIKQKLKEKTKIYKKYVENKYDIGIQ